MLLYSEGSEFLLIIPFSGWDCCTCPFKVTVQQQSARGTHVGSLSSTHSLLCLHCVIGALPPLADQGQ